MPVRSATPKLMADFLQTEHSPPSSSFAVIAAFIFRHYHYGRRRAASYLARRAGSLGCRHGRPRRSGDVRSTISNARGSAMPYGERPAAFKEIRLPPSGFSAHESRILAGSANLQRTLSTTQYPWVLQLLPPPRQAADRF